MSSKETDQQYEGLCAECRKHDWAYHLDPHRKSKDEALYLALKERIRASDRDYGVEILNARIKTLLKARFPYKSYQLRTDKPRVMKFPFPADNKVMIRITEGSNEAAFYLGKDATAIDLPSLSVVQRRTTPCTFCSILPGSFQDALKAQCDSHQSAQEFYRDMEEEPLLCVFGHVRENTLEQTHPMHISISSSSRFYSFVTAKLRRISESNSIPRHIVNLGTIEPGLVRSWYEECSLRHKKCGPLGYLILRGVPMYDKVLTTHAQGFKLVDVQQNRVVNAPSNSRYIALSYVWGDVPVYQATTSAFKCEKGQHIYASSSHLSLDDVSLPKTISDAMQVVRSVGERYLWVDSLCINQDDPEELKRMLESMIFIYGNAAFTIVAASGMNANAGLPRLWPTSSVETEPVVRIGHERFVPLLKELPQTLSPWSDRAWTYQEGFYSRKILLFLQDRVYYVCQEEAFCEEYSTSPSPYGLRCDCDFMSFRMNALDNLWAARPGYDKRNFLLGNYGTHVTAYTSRKLTKQDDILKAFAAISKYIDVVFRVRSCWGLPTHIFDAALAWTPREVEQKSLPHSGNGIIRRVGFPSWSWASYIGPIDYDTVKDGLGWPDPSSASDQWPPKEGSSYRSCMEISWDFQLPSVSGSADVFHTGILKITAPMLTLVPPVDYRYLDATTLDGGQSWTEGQREVLVLGKWESAIHHCFNKEIESKIARDHFLVLVVAAGSDGIYRREGCFIVNLNEAAAACQRAEARTILLG